jgi:chemotaxis protein MotA
MAVLQYLLARHCYANTLVLAWILLSAGFVSFILDYYLDFSVATMTRSLVIVCLALLLTSLFTVLARNSSLALVFDLPGLLVVLGGTLVATMISQSRRAVFSLLRSLPHKLAEPTEERVEIVSSLLKLADSYRRSDIRGAEAVAKALPASFLKTGLYLVIDRHSKDHLIRILQWHIGKKRDELEGEVLLLRTMGSYAPAFGMLGTLFGLINMLYGLGDSALDHLGVSMGFAMMTTVYGLIAATLIFKPLAVKLERQVKQRLAWMYAQYEAVLMIYERQHPQLIKAYLDAFVDDQEAVGQGNANAGLFNHAKPNGHGIRIRT